MNKNIIGSIILEGASTAEDAIIIDGNSDRVIAEGTLQDLDVENRNHRIYEKKDIEPEINGPRMKELIAAKQMKGEAGHPLSNDIVRQQTIDPKLTCVNFLKIWIEGNLVKSQFKGTNNDYGEYFDKDLREGCKPAFSLRALGAIENVSGKAYVRGVRIITFDHVLYPSHRKAYTERLITENALSCDINAVNVDENAKIINEMNEVGRIIHLTGNDAQDVLNRLQRESASIDCILNTFDGLADRIAIVENNKLRMSTKYGEIIYLNLDEHVENLIMNYVYGL